MKIGLDYLFNVVASCTSIYEACQFRTSQSDDKFIFDPVIAMVYSSNSYMDYSCTNMDSKGLSQDLFINSQVLKLIYCNLQIILGLITAFFVSYLFIAIEFNGTFIKRISNGRKTSYYKIIHCCFLHLLFLQH